MFPFRFYIFHFLASLSQLDLYRVAHKKWTISCHCIQHVYDTDTENLKTVTKTLFSMSTLRSQSFLKLSDQSNPSDVNMFIYDITNDVTKNI